MHDATYSHAESAEYCQRLYNAIENIRQNRRRKRKTKNQLVNHALGQPTRAWTREELAAIAYSSYLDLAKDRIRRPPPAEVIHEIGNYLNCTQNELNTLLIAAGYTPVKRYLEDEELQIALSIIRRNMAFTSLPAYLMDHRWLIYEVNPALSRLFGLSASEHAAINRAYPSQLAQLLIPGLPFFELAMSGGVENWQYCARRDLAGFRLDNSLNQYEKWYVDLLQTLIYLPNFAAFWDMLDSATNIPPALANCPEVQVGAMIWPCRPQGGAEIRGFWSYTPFSDQIIFPQMVTFVPLDDESTRVLRSLHILG